MARQQQLDPRQAVQILIAQYNVNPNAFTNDEVAELANAAQQLGIEFDIPESAGRIAGNLLFNAADTALLGLLPNEWGPDQMTSLDRIAGGVGDVAGFFTTPWAIGGKVAGLGMTGLGKLAQAGAGAGLRKGIATAGGKAQGLLFDMTRKGLFGRGTEAVMKGKKVVEAARAPGAAMAASKGVDYAVRGAQLGAKYGMKGAGAAARGALKVPNFTRRAMQFGVASGASKVFEDLGDANFENILGRTFGGAITGGAAYGVGSLAKMLSGVSKLSGSVGLQQAIRVTAAAIYGNMTAPERSQYPQEFVEEFIKNAIVAYR